MTAWVLLAAIASTSLSGHFKGQYGGIEMFDSQAKLSFRVNPSHLATPIRACSSGYLFLATQALVAGKLDPINTSIRYDAVRFPSTPDWPVAWQQEQDLTVALRFATPWYFAELRQRLGQGAWQMRAQQAGFGNLQGPIEEWTTTILQQVNWIRRLQSNALGLNGQSRELIRRGLRREQAGTNVLFGSGGRCPLPDGTAIAWHLGWVERNKSPVFYGLTVEGKSRDELSGEALRIAKDTLNEMNFLGAAQSSP